MSVQRWEQAPMTLTTGPVGRDVIDGWATQIAAVAKLAEYIAPTEFVPRAYRGQPAAVAAAILAGRELGIGPMTALQHLYVVDGRPAMSAQLMRALVLAAGHRLRITEATSTRATVVGGRRGDAAEYPVTWTMDDARNAKLAGRGAWTAYPRAMLLARATGELCRGIFPDVIGGMAYTVEEAGDMPPEGMGAAPEPAAPSGKARKTVQRSPRRTPPDEKPNAHAVPADAAAPAGPSGEPSAPPGPEDLPPLPEDENGPLSPANPEDDQPPPPEPARPSEGWKPVTAKQLGAVFANLGELDLAVPRERRLHTVSGIVSRRLESLNQLTRDEAAALIDTLVRVRAGGHADEELPWLVREGWARIGGPTPDAAYDPDEDEDQPPLWEPTESEDTQ